MHRPPNNTSCHAKSQTSAGRSWWRGAFLSPKRMWPAWMISSMAFPVVTRWTGNGSSCHGSEREGWNVGACTQTGLRSEREYTYCCYTLL
jgi:hypothetical protein